MIVFDIEATSTKPDQICQISYLIVGDTIVGKNFYFTVDSMNEYAQRVHGLSMQLLEELSGGKRFLESCEEIYSDFSAASIVFGHNVSFDITHLQAEFKRTGKIWTPKRTFCTMQHFTPILKLISKKKTRKPPSLAELCRYYGLMPLEIMKKADAYFRGGTKAHDARYDTTATWLCLLSAQHAGHIRGLPGGEANGSIT